MECPPVESVARIFIEYLNTVGYDNLRTRCIGFTMADVIEVSLYIFLHLLCNL